MPSMLDKGMLPNSAFFKMYGAPSVLCSEAAASRGMEEYAAITVQRHFRGARVRSEIVLKLCVIAEIAFPYNSLDVLPLQVRCS